MTQRVEVIIAHKDRKESLRLAVESLAAQTMIPAVRVVDNGSSDGTIGLLRNEFPWVSVTPLDRNHGFGGAVNRGVEESDADLVIFMNNDAVADPRFVERLVEEHQSSGAAMVAGCMRSPSGTVESLGVEIDRSLNAYDVGFGLAEPTDHVGQEPLGPSGGAALFIRSVFRRAGGFDEALFAYLEDVDLAIRLRLDGEQCASAPDAVVWHKHSETLGARSDGKNYLMGYGRGYILWKYGCSLRRIDRARGLLADFVVSAGKLAIDRNAGSIRGRAAAAREHPSDARPRRNPAFDNLPTVELSTLASLRRRLSRRR